MKRKSLLFFILALTVVLLICSCGGKIPNLFVVDFETNTTESSVQSLAIEEGKTCSRPQDPTKEGYIFLGWYNGETLWNFATDTVTSDLTLTAKWQRITYTVTFNSDGGSEVAKQTINYGDVASKPQNPAKLDSEFLGWYNGEKLWNFDTDTVTENITLTAKWKNCTVYTVTFDSDGGTAVNKQNVMHNEKLTEPTPPTKAGHKFIGWHNGETLWNFATTAITSNITLKAKWEVSETYTVTFNSDGGSAVNTQHIVVGQKAVEPTPPTKENHLFLGWFNGEVKWNFATDVISTSITLTAKWENTTTYTVLFNSDGGTEVAPQYIVHGGKVSDQFTEKEDHLFLGWYNGETLWNFDIDTVTENITLTAKWKNNTLYTVTFDSDGGIYYAPQNVRHGGKTNSPGVPAKKDSRFIGWYNGDDLWDFNTDTVTADITLKAKYEHAPTYTVTFKFSNDGDKEETILTYYVFQGEKVTPPQIVTTQIFEGWYLEETYNDKVYWDPSTAPTSDMILVADIIYALPAVPVS